MSDFILDEVVGGLHPLEIRLLRALSGHATGLEAEIAADSGLSAAQFRRAGVETLVGSLWKVDDAGTLELMGGFYEELGRGTDVGRALQHAQQSMIAAGDEYAHPWYWAGFTVVGDWR